MRGSIVGLAWLPLTAALLGACEGTAPDPLAPSTRLPAARPSLVDGLQLGLRGNSALARFTICSVGADATYAWQSSGWRSFTNAGVSYPAGAADSGSLAVASGGATAPEAWASGRCRVAFRYALPLHGASVPLVRSTYEAAPGFRLDSVVRDSVKGRDLSRYAGPAESDSTARGSATMAGVVHNDVGQIAFFHFSRYSPCTWSLAWWRAHAGSTATPLLPLWLGTARGALSVQVTSAAEAVPLLTVNGNATTLLRRLDAELLAAKLNLAAGADGSAVAATVAAGDAFLARHDDVPASQRAQVLGWITALDRYNDGAIGPGHCSG